MITVKLHTSTTIEDIKQVDLASIIPGCNDTSTTTSGMDCSLIYTNTETKTNQLVLPLQLGTSTLIPNWKAYNLYLCKCLSSKEIWAISSTSSCPWTSCTDTDASLVSSAATGGNNLDTKDDSNGSGLALDPLPIRDCRLSNSLMLKSLKSFLAREIVEYEPYRLLLRLLLLFWA